MAGFIELGLSGDRRRGAGDLLIARGSTIWVGRRWIVIDLLLSVFDLGRLAFGRPSGVDGLGTGLAGVPFVVVRSW